MIDRKSINIASLLLVFVVIGGYLVRNSVSTPSLAWMYIYSPEDFANAGLAEIVDFFKNLRAPIPPVIGLGEIISTKLFGSPILITDFAYRISLVGVYCLAIVMAGTSYKRMISAFFVSLLFLYVTTIIHPGNPLGYDIFCPFFFLIYVWLLKKSAPSSVAHKWQMIFLPCGAGFFLAMTELTRPYIFFILPILVLSAYWSFRKETRSKQFIAFIFPVLLLSGGWHGYQFLAHQQITYSNHTGFNLSRAWPNVPQIDFIKETNNAPIKYGRWPNLNTAEHSDNSKQRQRFVFMYWLDHPYASAQDALVRILDLLSGDPAIYEHEPQSDWFGVYKLVLYATSSLIIFSTVLLCVQGIRLKRIPHLLSNQDNTILLFAAASIVLMAIGERGEEARFLISVLPFLATLPICRAYTDPPKPARW